MDNSPYINIALNERGISVYRYTKIDYLLKLVVKGENTLLPPKKWDDPWENALLQSTFRRKDGSIYWSRFRDRMYGQCWTMDQQERDAFWRICVPNGGGVRLKSTISRLYQSLKYFEPAGSFFIGKVQYEPVEVIEKLFKDTAWVKEDSSARRRAKTLLLKRVEFEMEREIRILFMDLELPKDKVECQIPDPSNFIEEVTFDPRMDDELYEVYKELLVKAGYNSDRINKSDLYRAPSLESPAEWVLGRET